jgi:hypothetical protein
MRLWVLVTIWGFASVSSAISLSSVDAILADLTNASIINGNFDTQISDSTKNQIEISKPRNLLLQTKELGQIELSYDFSQSIMQLYIRNDLGEFRIQGADAEAIHKKVLSLIRTQRLAHSSLSLSYFAYTQLDSAALFDGAMITRVIYRVQPGDAGQAKIGEATGFELVNGRGEILQISLQPSDDSEPKLSVQATNAAHVTKDVPLSKKANAKLLNLLKQRSEYFQKFYAAANDVRQLLPPHQNQKSGLAIKILPKFLNRFFSPSSQIPETISLQLIPSWEMENDQSGRELTWKKAYRLGNFKPVMCSQIYQGF